MKFTVNDQTYYVKWTYPYTEPLINKRRTTCIIYQADFHHPIVIGHAECKPPDQFCKNTGRKISLDRALNKLFPNYSFIKGESLNISAKARAIAWQEYFKESPRRTGKKTKVTVEDILNYLEGLTKLEAFNEREDAKKELCKSLLQIIKSNRLNDCAPIK